MQLTQTKLFQESHEFSYSTTDCISYLSVRNIQTFTFHVQLASKDYTRARNLRRSNIGQSGFTLIQKEVLSFS